MKAGIAGAGIMGCLLALALKNKGWQVTLFDEHPASSPPSNCSYAAAGFLAPRSELDKADAVIFRLGMESLDQCWPKILQQLPPSLYFKRKGALVLHHPQDWAEWRQFSSGISSQLGNDCYQRLTAQQLLELEPELSKFQSAYYFLDEAQIDSQAVLLALREHLRQQAVQYNNTLVTAVQPGVIIAQSGRQSFDCVFDCRGLGAKAIFPDLRGIRGELLWLFAPEVHIQRPLRFLHPRYNIYLIPRPHHHYLLGASELETEDNSAISVRTTLELLTAAYYLHAGFAEARIVKTVTQSRPVLPHHQPRIKYSDRFIAVNGLYRHGYLIAPALAEEILRGLYSNQQSLHYPELWETYHDHHLP